MPDKLCLQHVEEEAKELFLYNHSERLPQSILQKLQDRIIVREAEYSHHFENSICSCSMQGLLVALLISIQMTLIVWFRN